MAILERKIQEINQTGIVPPLSSELSTQIESTTTLMEEAFMRMEELGVLEPTRTPDDIDPNGMDLEGNVRYVLGLSGQQLREAVIFMDSGYRENAFHHLPIRDEEGYIQDPTREQRESGPISFYIATQWKRMRDGNNPKTIGDHVELAQDIRKLLAARRAQVLLGNSYSDDRLGINGFLNDIRRTVSLIDAPTPTLDQAA